MSAGIVLPTGWLVSGANLVRATLVVEGLVLIAVGATGVRFAQLPATMRLSRWSLAPEEHERLSARTATSLLAGVTLVAFALRTIHLGDDLWVDEVYTVRQYASSSIRHILSTYHDPNNHLLNSLLVHASVRCSAFASGRSGFPL